MSKIKSYEITSLQKKSSVVYTSGFTSDEKMDCGGDTKSSTDSVCDNKTNAGRISVDSDGRISISDGAVSGTCRREVELTSGTSRRSNTTGVASLKLIKSVTPELHTSSSVEEDSVADSGRGDSNLDSGQLLFFLLNELVLLYY